jgi:hypothetical protein
MNTTATMTLSQAIRLGIELIPGEAQTRTHGNQKTTADALASAWVAQVGPENASLYTSRALAKFFPELDREEGHECPLRGPYCPKPLGGNTLEAKIIHLHDEHGFNREQVADCLESRGL